MSGVDKKKCKKNRKKTHSEPAVDPQWTRSRPAVKPAVEPQWNRKGTARGSAGGQQKDRDGQREREKERERENRGGTAAGPQRNRAKTAQSCPKLEHPTVTLMAIRTSMIIYFHTSDLILFEVIYFLASSLYFCLKISSFCLGNGVICPYTSSVDGTLSCNAAVGLTFAAYNSSGWLGGPATFIGQHHLSAIYGNLPNFQHSNVFFYVKKRERGGGGGRKREREGWKGV